MIKLSSKKVTVISLIAGLAIVSVGASMTIYGHFRSNETKNQLNTIIEESVEEYPEIWTCESRYLYALSQNPLLANQLQEADTITSSGIVIIAGGGVIVVLALVFFFVQHLLIKTIDERINERLNKNM